MTYETKILNFMLKINEFSFMFSFRSVRFFVGEPSKHPLSTDIVIGLKSYDYLKLILFYK